MQRDKMGAELHLYKDKAELVHVGDRSLHKRPPWVCSGMDYWSCSAKLVAHERTGLTNCLAGRNLISVHRVQIGRGGCGIVGTRRSSAFCNQPQFHNLVLYGRNNMSAQVAGRQM